MILVDTSVLSLAFRRRVKPSPEPPSVGTFRHLIEEDRPVAIPGIVFQELLSGVATADEFDKLRDLLEGFPLILATPEHHMAAARISNACRQAGIVASAVDCLIAGMAITMKSELLTVDKDFVHMAPHCDLRLLE